MAEFDGVVNQVVEYLLYFSHIGSDHKRRRVKNQFNADKLFLADALESSRRIPDNGVDIKVRNLQISLFVVVIVQGQKPACEVVKPFCLREYDI